MKVKIKEIVEHSLSDKERKALIDFITYDCMSKKDRKDYFHKLLNDLLETENEFDKRHEVIKSIKTLIKAIE